MNIVANYYYFNGTHKIICRSNNVHSLTLIVPVRLLRDSDDNTHSWRLLATRTTK